jgi:hypothetical protein
MSGLSLATNLQNRYDDMLVGNATYIPSNFYSIATQTVDSGGASSIQFLSIPNTYTHLQIRGIVREASGGFDQAFMQLNSDTGSNYASHYLYGQGASAGAGGTASTISMSVAAISGSNQSSSVFGATVIDILDYANTNKYKTVRSLSGIDNNGSGYAWFASGLWQNTNAVSNITILSTYNFVQYTQFALYGVK